MMKEIDDHPHSRKAQKKPEKSPIQTRFRVSRAELFPQVIELFLLILAHKGVDREVSLPKIDGRR
jgi:hypothetical protein